MDTWTGHIYWLFISQYIYIYIYFKTYPGCRYSSPINPPPKASLVYLHAMAIERLASKATSASHRNQPTDQIIVGLQKPLVFDTSVLQYQSNIPEQFIWPDEDMPSHDAPELPVPLIDIAGFLSGDPVASLEASRLIGEACKKHGFFLVVNHGVDENLILDAHRHMDSFFGLPLHEKQRAQRKVGEPFGYASSFTGRFSSKLPWKETLSLRYSAESPSNMVQDYIINTMGDDFQQSG